MEDSSGTAALYRGMDRAALDAAYNNTAAVADSARIVADWRRRSDAMRKSAVEWRYGPAGRNRIDFFGAGAGTPLLVFIHGGYWQMRAKELFAFLAAGPLAHGIDVALVGYTLAPAKRLDGIVAEILSSLDFLANKNPVLYVSGWSAGGHLAAMAMGHPAVAGGLAISGIYDLEPIRLCYLNEMLMLDEDECLRNSPLRLPPPRKPFVITYGTAELPELQRQSELYATAIGQPARPLGGHNHFTILEELAADTGALTRLVCTLMDG